jgi:hypothetical protein
MPFLSWQRWPKKILEEYAVEDCYKADWAEEDDEEEDDEERISLSNSKRATMTLVQCISTVIGKKEAQELVTDLNKLKSAQSETFI